MIKYKQGFLPPDVAYALYNAYLGGELPLRKKCNWYGTKWKGKGKDAVLLFCGEKVVGVGLFKDPTNQFCGVYNLCERHANRPIQKVIAE